MKKKLFTLLALFACVLSASADNTISVKKVYITPGGVASFGIDLNNTDELCGFTMFMTLPEGITLNGEKKCGDAGEDGYAINKTARTQGELVDPTGSNPYGLGYISTKALPGNSGAIIQVNIKAASTLVAGTVLSGKIYDINFGALGGGSDIPLADANFEIEVTDKIVLDENSEFLPISQTSVDVLVKRTLKKDIWQTICLPIDMTYEQTKAAFGDDVKFAELPDGADFYTVDGTSLTVNFIPSDISGDKFYANWPYIVKPSKDVSDFTVSGVNVDPKEENATQIWTKKVGKTPTTFGKFVGLLHAGETIPADNLFISGNKFYFSNGSTTIKGFRGYFYFKDFDSSASAPEINFIIDGEETTNIEGLQILTDDGQYYNLKGQKVDNPTEKGVYIQNGKKIVVK